MARWLFCCVMLVQALIAVADMKSQARLIGGIKGNVSLIILSSAGYSWGREAERSLRQKSGIRLTSPGVEFQISA